MKILRILSVVAAIVVICALAREGGQTGNGVAMAGEGGQTGNGSPQ